MQLRSFLRKSGTSALGLLLVALLLPCAALAATNIVEIDGAHVGDAWGYSDGRGGFLPPSGNELHITADGNVTGWAGGAYGDGVDATGNSVVVDGGDVGASVIGAEASGGASAIGNHVTINRGSTVGEYVYGGGSWGTGEVSRNTVTITGGRVTSSVFGGRGNGLVNGNEVTVNDGSTLSSSVYGGRSYGTDALVSGNSVTINGSTTSADVIAGGWGQGTSLVNDNHVTINGGSVNIVHGGRGTNTAEVSGNSVIITGGTISANVNGGYSTDGSATDNTVEWTGGTIGGNVYGGDGSISNGNSILVNGAGIAHSNAIVGGRGDSTAAGNSVTLQNGTVEFVRGGESTGDVTGNRVTIAGGTVNKDIYGGLSNSGAASDNTVEISAGTIGGSIYGGHSDNGAATGNHVIISGGTVTGSGAEIIGGQGATAATGNTVTIFGTPTINGAALSGGVSFSSGDAFTGNTLNVWNYSGAAQVSSIGNFEYFNFVLSADRTRPVLSVADEASLMNSREPNQGSVVTGVSTLGGTDPMQSGQIVTLIDATDSNEGINAANFEQTHAQGKHGATLNYAWSLNSSTISDNRALVATLENVKAAPQTKVLSEGFLGGLALATQGADLAAGQGMANAVGAAAGGFGAFGALSGASLRYNTGSHVDMNSLSLMAGLARGADTGIGRLTGGAFIEYGRGSYDTYNSFGGVSANGDGDAWHVGGGILGRMDFSSAGCGNWYAEASARLGVLENDYSNSHLLDAMGQSAKGYDSSSSYYGLHLGVGYVLDISEKASLDLQGKYFWTRQGGDSVILATNDPVTFEAVDSHRLRLGGRFSYNLNDSVSPYVGAAYEHEFDGEARASTYGHTIDAPSMRGGTGIAEVGMTLRPSRNFPATVDVGVQGYVGKRAGVTGSVRLGWSF